MDRALPAERAQEEETVAVVVPRGRTVASSADVDHVARRVTRPEAAVVEECRDDIFVHLSCQRRWNRRLWRRLARATEAVAGRPVAGPRPGSAELRQGRKVRPEEAQEPS